MSDSHLSPDRSPTAEEERVVAREVYENAVFLAIQAGDRESFQRYLANLRPYYNGHRYFNSDAVELDRLRNLFLSVVRGSLNLQTSMPS